MKVFTFFVKILLFLASFSLEVTVHAAERQLIEQEPHDCLKAGGACAVENLNEAGFDIKVGDSVITLDHGSSVIRKSEGEVRLVKGTIWVKARGPVTVSSEFGTIENLASGDFWVTKTDAQVTALAISTDVQLNPRGSAEHLLISQGLQNTLGQVGFDGRATTGVPLPISFKDHVIRWGRLYRGPKKDFEASVDEFHEKWMAATDASATIHKALYDRVIASAEEAAKVEAAKKAKAEAENKALRDMFRRRVFQGL